MRALNQLGGLVVASTLTCIACAQPALAQSVPPRLEWVRTWDGGDVDTGHGVVVDAAGDIYVLGDAYWSNYRDVMVFKYTPAGVLVWEARYDGPGHSWDEPAGIQLMPGGGVVVTASSENAQGADDIVTLRYSAFGTLEWEQRYSHPSGFWDLPTDIEVDAAGNIYVTGSVYAGSATFGDIVTLKYAPDGTPLWARHFTGPGSNKEYAFDVEVDGLGNVFVCGEVHTDAFDWRDALLLKYTPAGDLAWSRTHGLPNVGGLDTFHSVACDGFGGAVVAGEVTLATGRTDVVTIRYDAAGNVAWSRQYDGNGHHHDRGFKVLLDAAGSAFVMAESDQGAPTYYDFVVVKYTAAGVHEATFTHFGLQSQFDSPADIALDGFGGVYVTGVRLNPGGNDYEWMTVKFDSAGRLMWERRLNASGGIDTASALALGPLDRVYVAGTFQTGFFDVALLGYQEPPRLGARWRNP